MKKLNYLFLPLLISLIVLSGCGDDDAPAPENEEEVVDLVILTFSPIGGGIDVVGQAEDPDGEGPEDFVLTDPIILQQATTYSLTIEMLNTETNELIHEEVAAEDEEHMLFFGFTDALFLSPNGDGNIDKREDFVDYGDQDNNQNPVGLKTTWKTGDTPASGKFRVLLKHQPGVKSETSTAQDGETDVDLTWNMEVQ